MPGSPVDAAARVITQHIQTRLGQNMVIENKPGGGTTIGLKAVMAAPADGYTLLFIGPNLVYTPVLYPSMNFDPFKSLAPVASVVSYSHVMVVAPAVPAKTVKEREGLELVQRELKDLSGRQEKIGKVTKDIATGKNEAK